MKALILNCTLKKSPAKSNTAALAEVCIEAFEGYDVDVEMLRVVDYQVLPGVSSDEGEGDQWPLFHTKILDSDIVIIASPTWLGHPSSVAQRVLERMDAMMTETDDQDRPVAFNKVAGVIVTGNEDGAHHVISEISGGLIDIGFTIPGQSWTYWNMGPGPGPSYTDTDHRHEWSKNTGETAVANLVAVAAALQENPILAD